jgi:AcrR family transcriptional regulator
MSHPGGWCVPGRARLRCGDAVSDDVQGGEMATSFDVQPGRRHRVGIAAFAGLQPQRLPKGRKPAGANNAPSQRTRLLAALIESMAEHGYVKSSVSDITSRALVSRRTFYENFESKEDAFLNGYATACSLVMDEVKREIAATETWQERLLVGMTTYIGSIMWSPAAALVFFRESWTAGQPAWDLRRTTTKRWAALVQSEIAQARAEDPELARTVRDLDDHLALAVVQGIEAIVIEALQEQMKADDVLRPCIVLLAGAAQADVHVFEQLIRSTPTRSPLRRFTAAP